MREVTLIEFKRLLKERLLEWPPFRVNSESRIYARAIEAEDNPSEWVWCSDP